MSIGIEQIENVTLNVLVNKRVTVKKKLGERRYNKPLYECNDAIFAISNLEF